MRTVIRLLVVTLAATAAIPLLAMPANAHGSMSYPISRGYECYLDNPEYPSLPACKAVVAAEGAQGSYDWMAENILAANGQSREIIPDGKLCSANKDEFKGLDLARSDWPTTSMVAGSKVTIKFIGTAPHLGTFSLYMTKNGYDPTKPLAWSDLQSTPFLQVANPPLVGGVYQMPVTLPAGSVGRNLIYTVWQRSDSAEAFYSCSDVMLTGGSGGGNGGGGTGGGATPSAKPGHSTAPSPVVSSTSGTGTPSSGASDPGMTGMPSSASSSEKAKASASPSPATVSLAGLPLTGNDAFGVSAVALTMLAVGVLFVYMSRRRSVSTRVMSRRSPRHQA